VNFKNTVIVMTSNVGSSNIQNNPMGFSVHARDGGSPDTKRRLLEALRQTFRPEFLNRIDEIVLFEPLSREQLGEIVGMQLGRLNERLTERGIGLELTDGARELIAEAGWDPAYGARPLKRAIQRLLENPLALRLLEGEFGEGDTVRAYAELGELRFGRAEDAHADEETVEPPVAVER
jgi:ATP-dependent Clp protease ATP-binding subunit ClpA